MKKLLVLTAIAAVLAVTGCSPTVLSLNSGDVLSVDANGHLTADTTYDAYSWQMILKADGTYEYKTFSYEYSNDLNYNKVSNEGKVQTGGFQGTYTWNTTNYVLNLTYSGEFRNTNTAVASAYLGVFSSQNSESKLAVFTSRNYYTYVYAKSAADATGKTFNRTQRWNYTNNNPTSYQTTIESYVIDTTAKTITYTSDNSSFGTNGSVIQFSRVNTAYSILTNLPDGQAFENGKTITFQLQCTSKVVANWFGGPTNTTTNNMYYDQLVFSHGGGFVICQGLSAVATRALQFAPKE